MSRTNTYKVRKDRWHSIRKNLTKESSKEDWLEVFNDIFLERFNDRYFNPAFLLITNGYGDKEKFKETQKGNGFAAITILTSSVEILNTLFSGRFNDNFNSNLNAFLRRNNIGQFKVNRSNNSNFDSFFSTVPEFKNYTFFNKDFYSKYRNTLFHAGMSGYNFNINTYIKEFHGIKYATATKKIFSCNFDLSTNIDYCFPLFINNNTLYRESFFFHFKYTTMKLIFDSISNNESIKDNINTRLSLARLLDVIYSEGNFQNYEKKDWWKGNIPQNNINLSNCQKLKNKIKRALNIRC